MTQDSTCGRTREGQQGRGVSAAALGTPFLLRILHTQIAFFPAATAELVFPCSAPPQPHQALFPGSSQAAQSGPTSLKPGGFAHFAPADVQRRLPFLEVSLEVFTIPDGFVCRCAHFAADPLCTH